MSNEWYVRQFGERDRLAVTLSFGPDPFPIGDDASDAGWGKLSLWVRGRCLTRNVSGNEAVSEDVQWSLTGLLQWLVDVGVRLVNEEPFPEAVRSDRIRDACEWWDPGQAPVLRLSEKEEDEWFLRRSEWGRHHVLRRAADDVALPHVLMRRLGDFLEVSWDNETWGAPRADLRFVEQRGTELVPGLRASATLRDALIDAARQLANRCPEVPSLAELASAAERAEDGEDDWRWLVHRQTARLIQKELAPLRDSLRKHTRARRQGWYVPHAPETLVLRSTRLSSKAEVETLLGAARASSARPMKAPLRRLVHPVEAPAAMPWKAGYERALEVRERLGWGNDPVPDLQAWMQSNNVAMTSHRLSSTVDLVTTRTDQGRSSAVLNPRMQSLLHREMAPATALGHILSDSAPVSVDGTWEHWPTAARARAFAAMLLLPEDGVRQVLVGRGKVRAEDVRRVMARFGTGPYLTTYHLKNLGLIESDERRVELLQQLAA